ncbi:MAG: arsenate reductase [Hyphomicrobiales bacterium]|nr:MAG: arsenate reductase [Hyphomicrobiales bacterium]
MTLTIYAIPGCNTVKKARVWLEGRGIEYRFHDFKKSGVPVDEAAKWIEEHGWEVLLNRAGTTFRKLPDDDKIGINEEKALYLMCHYPSVIKRPVLDLEDRTLVGFKAEMYEAAFRP